VRATWSPATGPSADVTLPPELTPPATTLHSDPDEQQSTEDSSDDGTQTYVYAITALSVVVVAFAVHAVHNKRKGRTPLAPNPPDNGSTATNPTCNAQQQPGPTVGADNDATSDTVEPAQMRNPDYQPTLPERLRNRDYAEITPNEDSQGASYATLGGDQQVYDQFYERPPDRHVESSA